MNHALQHQFIPFFMVSSLSVRCFIPCSVSSIFPLVYSGLLFLLLLLDLNV